MFLVVLITMSIISAHGATANEVRLPPGNLSDGISAAANTAHRWRQGSYEVWVLRGDCIVNQGLNYLRAESAVLWIDRPEPSQHAPTKVIAYLEGDVNITHGEASGEAHNAQIRDATWFGRLYTSAKVEVRAGQEHGEPEIKPALFARAHSRLDPSWRQTVQRTQFTQFEGEAGPAADAIPPGTRRLRAFPRSDARIQAQWFPSPGGEEWVVVITSGINLIIDGVVEGGPIDISTDRMVIWNRGGQPDLSGNAIQDGNVPLEIYMEGNLVFRQGERVIYARQMYYDVTRRVGIILDSELLSPVEGYDGLLRMKADVIQQLDESNFVAQNALLTSSRLGEPRYWLQSERITLRDQQFPVVDPATGVQPVDPRTGEPLIANERLARSEDNFIYVGGVPVFYWPTLATDLEEPNFYVDRIRVRNDNIFGTQIYLDFDIYQLFSVTDPPEGTEWTVSTDYLSERGPAAGTNFQYTNRADVFGLPGISKGFIDVWGIYDEGEDNLGRGRRAIPPDDEFRGRVFGRHRQTLPDNFTLTGEVGYISDTNFLEQYYENEWDTFKDQTTGVELKQILDNRSWSVTADVRLNDFFTQTEWLPRLDHFWLGQPLFGDSLTWFEHSQAAYARLETADIPPGALGAGIPPTLFPWEADVDGERLVTRQEIDLPLELGPVKFVPYVLGEAAHWGEALDGDDLQRLYGQAGARASVPFWAVDPSVQSRLLNLNGLAHKVVFDAEFSISESNRDLEELPLYDPLWDDNLERYARRFQFLTFGGPPIPDRFDPRFYGLRSGLGSWVTSPSTEVADDLTVVRMGMRHRWQTKRGAPGNQRIIDWITLDTNAVWFPDEQEDNFNADFGLINYDFRWHVGDQFTVLSYGDFDTFADGLRLVSVGGLLRRPPRGNIYLGLQSIEGPISTNVITGNYAYRMSPKWVSQYGTEVDLSSNGNVRHRLGLTRVGESLLVHAGFNYNQSKDSFGVRLMIEPRFLPDGRLTRQGDVFIPPAFATGLE